MADAYDRQMAVLTAREERARRTRRFLDRLHRPAIVLTINVPGPDKNEPWVAGVMARGEAAIRRALERRGLPVGEAESCVSAAGPEWRGAVGPDSSPFTDRPCGGVTRGIERPEHWGKGNAGPGIDPVTLKRLAVDIEESHPLGRLFDIDVFGDHPTAVGREALGLAPRRCLVCDRPAHECVRSKRHSLTAVRTSIATLIQANLEDLPSPGNERPRGATIFPTETL